MTSPTSRHLGSASSRDRFSDPENSDPDVATRPCRFAGPQCPHEAVVTLRIGGLGDRPVCQSHHEWMVAMGMNVRVLEPGPVAEWLRVAKGKDITPWVGGGRWWPA